jgi:hypothetical protein
MGPHKCFDMDLMNVSLNVVYSVSDGLFLALPIFVLKNLDLPQRTKVGVGSLFLLGLIVCVSCMMKAKAFNGLYETWDITCRLHSTILHANRQGVPVMFSDGVSLK